LDTFSGAVYADIQVRREAWSAMFVIFGLVDMGFSMTIDSAPPGGPPEARLGAPTVVSAARARWPWRRAALFLAGAAQLTTISALVGADPIPASWSSLLLAAAPAPLAAAAVFAPAPVSLLAAVAGPGSWPSGSSRRSPTPAWSSSRRWWCWPSPPSSSGASRLWAREKV